MDAGSLSILRSRVVKNEGVVLHAYYDKYGYPTQGVGRKLSSEKYIPLSQFPDIDMPTAMAWLDEDLSAAENGLNAVFLWTQTMDGIRLGVVVEMAFQMGVAGVEEFHHFIAACEDQDYETAAQDMLESEWARETPARCQELSEIMKSGEPCAS